MKKKIVYFIMILFLIFIILINKNFLIKFFNDICVGFNRTIVEEKRYILFLDGLKKTLIISIFSISFGTILGFCVFLTQKFKITVLSIFSKILVKFLQGIPVTVLLLIFYFVIFGSININPIFVAIITFSIYFSAYISEVFKGAYASINRGQIDSASALGFTKIQTLKYIIIPQVLAYVIPVFKNECVSLIKSTSIAGYISVMDLTRASDIVRNRTYQPFFPLIFTAIIYFLICFVVTKILDLISKKVNPRLVNKNE